MASRSVFSAKQVFFRHFKWTSESITLWFCFDPEFEKWSECFYGCFHVDNRCKNEIMFLTKLEHLLLFGCLFQIYISHGITSTFARVEKSIRVSNFGESKKYIKTRGVNESKNREKPAVMSTDHGGKQNTGTLIHRSVFKKLSRNGIIHTRIHNRRLKQELRKRQVS